MVRTRRSNTVKRKFHFFNVVGEGFEQCLSEINSLSGEDMYMDISEVRDVYLNNRAEQGNYYFGCFVSAKRGDYPEKVSRGNKELSDLGLGESEGIGEKTYILYVPSSKTLVVEYNHYGTRVGHIEEYINHIAGSGLLSSIFEDYSLMMVMNRDIQLKLSELEHVASLEIKIKEENISHTSEIDEHLKGALEAAAQIGGTNIVSLKIKSKRGEGRLLDNNSNLFTRLKRFIQHGSAQEVFESLKISGLESGETKLSAFDLLKDKIEVVESIIKMGSSRILDENDVFNKLKSAYLSKRELLINL
ncbi:hypothetical protein XF24_00038 [candidate division SR1 bacterium Aalborg_AAW-1]|nr:hypothetical protein XF24_00038 [candidate division SR1 bacterium Aalborg_AAW-1]